MRLYELTTQYKTLADFLETAESPEDWAPALAQLQGSIEDKAENIGKVILAFEREAEAIENEAKRLNARRVTIGNRREALKTYLLDQMLLGGMDKIRRDLFTVSVRSSPPSVTDVDMGLLPAEFIRVIPERLEPDRVAILKSYRETQAAPLGAVIAIDKKYLQIR